MEVAVISVLVRCHQVKSRDARSHLPTSVAQVTSQRTISLLLQFRVDSVILITCKAHAAL